MRSLDKLAVIILLVVATGAGFGYWWRTHVLTTGTPIELPGGNLDSMGRDTLSALRHADFAAMEQASVALKPIGNADDAQQAIETARMRYAFHLASSTTEYLTSVLDASNPAAEPYKSSAGYTLLHTFYDTRSIVFMADAVSKSSFMTTQIVPQAKTYFPAVFAVPVNQLKDTDIARYFAAHLVALASREDTIAAPANAAQELISVYRKEKDPVEKTRVHDLAVAQYKLAQERLNARLYRNTQPVSAYDTVVGINHMALAADSVHVRNLEADFPEIAQFDITTMMEVSRSIAIQENQLVLFTTYLDALFSARYLPAGSEHDAQVEALVRTVTGEPPFALKKYSWANNLLGAKTRTGGVFTQKNLAVIASRSETMRRFLVEKDGWTEADLNLKK